MESLFRSVPFRSALLILGYPNKAKGLYMKGNKHISNTLISPDYLTFFLGGGVGGFVLIHFFNILPTLVQTLL